MNRVLFLGILAMASLLGGCSSTLAAAPRPSQPAALQVTIPKEQVPELEVSLSPNEKILPGETVIVQWKLHDERKPSLYSLELFRDGQPFGFSHRYYEPFFFWQQYRENEMISTMTNVESFPWTTPPTLPVGTYTIRIKAQAPWWLEPTQPKGVAQFTVVN